MHSINFQINPLCTAYIWNTDTNSLQHQEIVLLTIIWFLFVLTIIVLSANFPKIYYVRKINWDNKFGIILLLIMLAFREVLDPRLSMLWNYGTTYWKIYTIRGSAVILGSTVGTMVISCVVLKTCTGCAFLQVAFGLIGINFIGVWVVGSFISIFIQAFIYPTEVISMIGFFVICLISIFTGFHILSLERFVNIDTTAFDLNNQIKHPKFCLFLQALFIGFCTHFFIPGLIIAILLLYMSLLQILQESPTSQLTQILLAFLPTIIAILLGYLIKSKFQNMHIKHQDANTQNEEGDSNIDEEEQNKCYSSNLNEETQYLNQPRRRLISNSGINERSREIVVTVQTHHDQTLDIDSESII